MLIQFNFKNFKSFRDEATLDLSASKMTEFSDRVVTVGSEKILPVAAIYGANASGKSNIYNAFEYMSDYVADSFKYGDEEEKFEEFRPTPFLFDSTSPDAESSFEVYFTLPSDKSARSYNYGFCINKEGVTEECMEKWFSWKLRSKILAACAVSESVNRICLLLFCSSSARLSSSSNAPWSIIPISSASKEISERM